jgi:hypothetical protein
MVSPKNFDNKNVHKNNLLNKNMCWASKDKHKELAVFLSKIENNCHPKYNYNIRWALFSSPLSDSKINTI